MVKSRSFLTAVFAGFVVCMAYGCGPSYPECYEDSDCTTENNKKTYRIKKY